MEKVLLLCFSNLNEYRIRLQEIREIHRPVGSIFVLENRDNIEEIFITFNTQYDFRMGGYIKINKKRDTNTLFTIDSVNYLSMQENGEIVKDWIPNWNEFNNCLILFRGNSLSVIPTRVKEIIKL